jgi:hypothetical protein
MAERRPADHRICPRLSPDTTKDRRLVSHPTRHTGNRLYKRSLRWKRIACRVLEPQKRTRPNDSELHRMPCCYPLRFRQKREFKRAILGGNLAGKTLARFQLMNRTLQQCQKSAPLYRSRDLVSRAKQFRDTARKSSSFDIDTFFDRVDRDVAAGPAK